MPTQRISEKTQKRWLSFKENQEKAKGNCITFDDAFTKFLDLQTDADTVFAQDFEEIKKHIVTLGIEDTDRTYTRIICKFMYIFHKSRVHPKSRGHVLKNLEKVISELYDKETDK